MSETLSERLPGALRRIGLFLGSDQCARFNRDVHADLMSLHAAAGEVERLKFDRVRLLSAVRIVLGSLSQVETYEIPPSVVRDVVEVLRAVNEAMEWT